MENFIFCAVMFLICGSYCLRILSIFKHSANIASSTFDHSACHCNKNERHSKRYYRILHLTLSFTMLKIGHSFFENLNTFVAGNYMFKVNNNNTRTRCEIYSKLTIKTPDIFSPVFIVNFEHISHLVLMLLLLTLSR